MGRVRLLGSSVSGTPSTEKPAKSDGYLSLIINLLFDFIDDFICP